MALVDTDRLIIESVNGDVNTGGWECSASLMNAQDLCDYSRRSNIFLLPEGAGLWTDDWLTGLRAFMMPRTITFDRKQSATQVTLSTSHMFLENAALQGIYFATVAVPTNSHQNTAWNLGKIVKHIVEEHTNIASWVDTSGIDTVNSTTINYYTVHESQSIWNTIKQIGANEFYVPYFTRDDRLIYAPHPMFTTASVEPIMELTTAYLIGQPIITYRDAITPDVVKLLALTDNGVILESQYPNTVFGTDSRKHTEKNLRCNSQARLDTLAHRLYMYLKCRFEVQVTLPGPWGLMMELFDRISLTYSGTTYNGLANVVWAEKNFWISRINVRRMFNFGAVTELTMTEESWDQGYFYSNYMIP